MLIMHKLSINAHLKTPTLCLTPLSGINHINLVCTIMLDLHYIQMQILRELLFHPNARFTDLNIADVTSDHFTYHIKTLIKYKFVIKSNGKYMLTNKGKEFANTMDTEKLKVEKQAKICVLIIGQKKQKGKNFILIQTRLKEPYYGYKGFITGKVRFGEAVIDAAKREFLEETGLSGNFYFKYIIHEHVYSNKNKLLEDKFFYVFWALNTKGKLIDILEGKNEWMLESEFVKINPLFYDMEELFKLSKKPPKILLEKKYFVDKF